MFTNSIRLNRLIVNVFYPNLRIINSHFINYNFIKHFHICCGKKFLFSKPKHLVNYCSFTNDYEEEIKDIVKEDEDFNRFEELSVDDFRSIIVKHENQEQIREKIQEILTEYEYEKYTTLLVPSTLSIKDIEMLVEINDVEERKKAFFRLYNKEKHKKLTMLHKQQHSKDYWDEKREKWLKTDSTKTGLYDSQGRLIYGLWHNSLVTKVYNTQIKKLTHSKMKTAAMFGRKLIVDVSDEKNHIVTRSKNLGFNTKLLYQVNRYKFDEPFDLHFCNVDMNHYMIKYLHNYLENWDKPSSFLSFHSQSYLDLFPNQNLVYISSNASQPLTYDENDIYIIPGEVNYNRKNDLLMYRLMKERIRTARIPFTENILWSGDSRKTININFEIVARILYNFITTKDWKSSIKTALPPEYVKKPEDVQSLNIALERKFAKRSFQPTRSKLKNSQNHTSTSKNQEMFKV